MTIECLKFKQFTSGAFQGFADFRIHNQNPIMTHDLFGCGYFSKNGKRWISMPSREYLDPETNEKKFIPVFRYVEKETNNLFSTHALKALDKYVSDQNNQST